MRTYTFICSLLIAAGATACASTQAEQVRDARMEKIDEQTVASTRMIEDRQEAREDAIETRFDMAAKTVEDANRPDENLAMKRLEMAQERAAYESKAQGRIETIDVRIRAAEQKLATLGPSAPVQLQAELESVLKERRIIGKDVKDLPEATDQNWEATMEGLDERLSNLNDRVKELTSAIEDA